MYTHARQFPHLAGLTDDEIRLVARRAMSRHAHYVTIMRCRNAAVLLGMSAVIMLLVSRFGMRLGLAMMIGGGAATVLLLLWNVVWVNTVLFRITRAERDQGR